MAPRKPNDTVTVRRKHGKRAKSDEAMLRSSGARHPANAAGRFALHRKWRAARDGSHDDVSAFGPLNGRNRFVASEDLPRTRYIGPGRPRRKDRSEI